MADPEARKKVVWEMDTLAMNDASYLILLWPEFYHVRWNFVKGWTHTPNLWSTNARMDTVWMDLPSCHMPDSRGHGSRSTVAHMEGAHMASRKFLD